ncbi:MAG TPA: LysR family transcriptional regulator, partial [Achromobacter sp.]|nr:LysR family transcriptional regulator [Achromobacter sp.]
AVLPQSALAAAADIAVLPVALGKPLRRSIALITRRTTIWSPLMKEFRAVVMGGVR